MIASQQFGRSVLATLSALSMLTMLPYMSAAAQREDLVRICLAPAAAQAPNTADAVAAVRETFTTFLTGPSLMVAPLTARLESQVREEAKRSGCPYVLFTTVKHERKTTGLFQRIAAGAVQTGAAQAAGYATSSGARIAAGAAAGGAANLAVSSQIKLKDELTLEYRLEAADGRTLVKNLEKRKATSDGEDLLTPLVQGASESIAAAVVAPSH